MGERYRDGAVGACFFRAFAARSLQKFFDRDPGRPGYRLFRVLFLLFPFSDTALDRNKKLEKLMKTKLLVT